MKIISKAFSSKIICSDLHWVATWLDDHNRSLRSLLSSCPSPCL